MSGWLTFWLVTMALGPVAWLIAWALSDKIGGDFTALGIFSIVLALLFVSAVGAVGGLGWLAVWWVGW